MATPRKSSAGRTQAARKAAKAAKPAKKLSAPVRAKKSDTPRGKSAAVRAPEGRAATRKPLAVKGKPVLSRSQSAAPARGTPATSRAGKSPATGPRRAPVPAPPRAEVRPLGVLPPGSIARGSGKAPATSAPRTPAPRSTAVKTPSAPQGAQRVTEHDLKDFEQRLLGERQKILKEMGHLENTVLKINQRDSAGDLSGYSFHMADVGTDAMEREKAFLFASAEGRTLLEINEALRRVYRGEYGICESCGQPIARARLDAMPHARLCVVCKEKEERTQRGAV